MSKFFKYENTRLPNNSNDTIDDVMWSKKKTSK